MSVLVTGGAGYIGSHTALALADRGETVVVLDDLSTGFAWAVPEGVPLVVGDVSDAALVSRTLQQHDVTEIIHFAARIIVPDSVIDPLGYYEANTAKTRALFEAAVRGGVRRVIFSSTAAVYGEPGVPLIGETVPTCPINPYGRSKLMSEWMLADAAHVHGLSYAVLRYFNVAGADPQGRCGQSSARATHLIKIASQAATGVRDGMEIYGTDYDTPDGTCIRDYLHVSDLADAHVAALARLRAGGGNITLNCGYGHGYSVREVVDVVKTVSGVDFPLRLSPRRPGDPHTLVAAVDRIRAELDWVPRFDDLPVIVRHALDWEAILAARKAGRIAASA